MYPITKENTMVKIFLIILGFTFGAVLGLYIAARFVPLPDNLHIATGGFL
jgi:hypothetical protein